MNIAIVGAGIVGISTALELARDGHQVTVYEQLNAAAEDASFAPGGWLSPCATQSLSAPGFGMPLSALQSGKGLLDASRMIGSNTWRWMRQWKRNEKQFFKHQNQALPLALNNLETYSQSLRWQHTADIDIAAERKSGVLVLLRTNKEVDFWNLQISNLLQAQGTSCKLLNITQTLALEPSLGQELPWVGAMHFPQGESINPRLWTQFLRYQLQELGATIRTGTRINAISSLPIGVEIAGHLHPYDAVVICTGAAHDLLKRLSLPIMTTWGYSITTPIRDALQAPRSAIVDWQEQATISRIGQRIRITAGLEMTTITDAHHTPTLHRMYRLLNDWFPGGANLSSPQVQIWRGARGYLPDGLPAVGNTGHKGIWVNLAHGSHGVSLAAGCARAISDMIAGNTPAIDMSAFHPQRF